MSDLNPYEEGLAIDLARAEARIEELESDLRKSALNYLAAHGQAAEAYQAQLAAEAKLAKLRAFLDELWDSQGYDARELHDLLKELDGVSDA